MARRPPSLSVEPLSSPPPVAGIATTSTPGKRPPNAYGTYALRQFVGDARRERAGHLVFVADGLITVHDVVLGALRPTGKPLRAITLRGLLMGQPRSGERRTRDTLRHLTATLGLDAIPRSTTISWLMDSRVKGARILAWLDAVETADLLPDGFPFSNIDGSKR